MKAKVWVFVVILAIALLSLEVEHGAAQPGAPEITGPPNGVTLGTFGPTLSWTLPTGSTQYHLQVIPFNDDGPGVDLIRPASGSFTIPAPPAWYGLLPNMTYTWRIRASAATSSIGPNDPSWGPWAESTFRTPQVSSVYIGPVAPSSDTLITSRTPILQWSNPDSNVFYFEVQLSKDPTFNNDAATATAMVYWVLIHGGVTPPPNSYSVPSAFPLEWDTKYHWRVRPRIQGDGKLIEWSNSFGFTVAPPPGLTRENPVPYGQSLVAPPGWEIQVTNVNWDAWPVVRAKNQFNDPPKPGNRMVLITLKVTNRQTRSATISYFYFKAVGELNVVYTPFGENSRCGVIPDALSGELFPGGTTSGNICFQHPASEDRLTLFTDFTFRQTDRRFFALK